MPPPANPSLSTQFTNFTGSSAGLEKTLRLIQAIAQITAELTVQNVLVARCLVAKSQLALTRRYFRFFSFITCFDRVSAILLGQDHPHGGMIPTIIDLGRFTSLGIYVLLENLTILHAMNVWPVPWNNSVLNEANKFWFYALSLSVIGALWEILFAPWPQAGEGRKGSGKKASKKGGGSSKARQTSAVRSVMPLVKRIVVDGCDLLLPGSFLGWVPVGDVGVGLAMVVSTVVASRDIWIKAQ